MAIQYGTYGTYWPHFPCFASVPMIRVIMLVILMMWCSSSYLSRYSSIFLHSAPAKVHHYEMSTSYRHFPLQSTYNYIIMVNYGYYNIYIYINMDIVRQVVFWTIYVRSLESIRTCRRSLGLFPWSSPLWSQQGARFPFGSPSLKTWKTQWWGGCWEERHGMESHGGGRRNMYKITHRIHVWYIWWHLPSIYPKC